eukprot:GEZU01020886.1.p1 GENE.GEZU01020886.1~~GEZU01020886.1.p1  ORF type:complete len:364 (+),score=118.70 GEZU01020886.1:276-1367(+)
MRAVDVLYKLAKIHINLYGDVASQFDLAIDYFKQALIVLQKAVKNSEGDGYIVFQCALLSYNIIVEMAYLLFNHKKYEEALQCFLQAHEIALDIEQQVKNAKKQLEEQGESVNDELLSKLNLETVEITGMIALIYLTREYTLAQDTSQNRFKEGLKLLQQIFEKDNEVFLNRSTASAVEILNSLGIVYFGGIKQPIISAKYERMATIHKLRQQHRELGGDPEGVGGVGFQVPESLKGEIEVNGIRESELLPLDDVAILEKLVEINHEAVKRFNVANGENLHLTDYRFRTFIHTLYLHYKRINNVEGMQHLNSVRLTVARALDGAKQAKRTNRVSKLLDFKNWTSIWRRNKQQQQQSPDTSVDG